LFFFFLFFFFFSYLFTVTTFMGGDLISVFVASFRVTCIDLPCGIWFGCVGLLFFYDMIPWESKWSETIASSLYTKKALMFDNKIYESL